MTRILYSAFDIVPSPKGASTHIIHNLRGLVDCGYEVHLMTPGDGILPLVDTLDGASVTRVPQDLSQNFLARDGERLRATATGRTVLNRVIAEIVRARGN